MTDRLGLRSVFRRAQRTATSSIPKIRRSSRTQMMSKFARVTVAVFGLSLFALAQAADPAATAPTPNAPSAAAAAAAKPTGTKVGSINIEQAIFASNEGRRDFDQLAKKFEPKQ